jgi:hypothetical protein
MGDAFEVIAECCLRGVRLSLEAGRLAVHWPLKADPDLLAKIQRNAPTILAVVKMLSRDHPPVLDADWGSRETINAAVVELRPLLELIAWASEYCRIALLSAAEAAGFPTLPVRPGHSIAPGARAWGAFARSSIPGVAADLAALAASAESS